MENQKPCFRFEIDNFSQNIKTDTNFSSEKSYIESERFVSGGCEWFLVLYPEGDYTCNDHMSVYLCVGDEYLLQPGWKRSARFYFAMLNQSGKVLFRSSVEHPTLCAEVTSWGFSWTLPLRKFEEEGFLENDKLIIEVYINNVDKKEEIVDVEGFEVIASQADTVRKMSREHRGFPFSLKLKNKVVKAEYMNVLLNLVNLLENPQRRIPWYIRHEACSDLTELMDAGFKPEFLKSVLGLEVVLERKKAADPQLCLVQQLGECVKKNLKLLESSSEMGSLKSKLIEDNSLERKIANGEWSRVQILEEKMKKLECSNISLHGLNVRLEEKMKRLECSNISLHALNGRLEDVSVESRESYEAVKSQVKQIEKSVMNLELMVSNLTSELDTMKAESSVDEFYLIDNVK